VWRPVIEDSTTLSLFFDFYAATSPPLSNTALECLVSRLHLLNSLMLLLFCPLQRALRSFLDQALTHKTSHRRSL